MNIKQNRPTINKESGAVLASEQQKSQYQKKPRNQAGREVGKRLIIIRGAAGFAMAFLSNYGTADKVSFQRVLHTSAIIKRTICYCDGSSFSKSPKRVAAFTGFGK